MSVKLRISKSAQPSIQQYNKNLKKPILSVPGFNKVQYCEVNMKDKQSFKSHFEKLSKMKAPKYAQC